VRNIKPDRPRSAPSSVDRGWPLPPPQVIDLLNIRVDRDLGSAGRRAEPGRPVVGRRTASRALSQVVVDRLGGSGGRSVVSAAVDCWSVWRPGPMWPNHSNAVEMRSPERSCPWRVTCCGTWHTMIHSAATSSRRSPRSAARRRARAQSRRYRGAGSGGGLVGKRARQPDELSEDARTTLSPGSVSGFRAHPPSARIWRHW